MHLFFFFFHRCGPRERERHARTNLYAAAQLDIGHDHGIVVHNRHLLNKTSGQALGWPATSSFTRAPATTTPFVQKEGWGVGLCWWCRKRSRAPSVQRTAVFFFPFSSCSWGSSHPESKTNKRTQAHRVCPFFHTWRLLSLAMGPSAVCACVLTFRLAVLVFACLFSYFFFVKCLCGRPTGHPLFTHTLQTQHTTTHERAMASAATAKAPRPGGAASTGGSNMFQFKLVLLGTVLFFLSNRGPLRPFLLALY